MEQYAAIIFLTPLTHTEFGQVLDAYEARNVLALHKLLERLKDKEETYEQKVSSVEFSLDNAWTIGDVRWVKYSPMNGTTLVLSRVEGEVTEFDLPDNLKEHIAKKKPVMVTKWY